MTELRDASGDAPVSAREALRLFEERSVVNLTVRDPIDDAPATLDWLPDGLTAPSLNLDRCRLDALPRNLRARRISARESGVRSIGDGLKCDFLDLSDTLIERLPDDVVARRRIALAGCRRLAALPDGLRTGALVLSRCVALAQAPRRLDVAFLDLDGCESLSSLPEDLTIRGGRLNIRDCVRMTALPGGLRVAELDVSGCLNLTRLPDDLEVDSWIDIGGSGLRELPGRLDHVAVRWRGVSVPRRVVFAPETLTAEEIFAERNAEIRRVMMERYGYERLIEAPTVELLDRDRDAGGERRLLRVPLPDDEDLVLVAVTCPSTGHQFVLRVPPAMTTCRQAVAWTAGFDDPDLYDPEKET